MEQAAFRALGPVRQVGIVVEDLERALDLHAAWGPWSIWTYDRSVMRLLECDDLPGDFAFRVALSAGEPQLELIQPLDDRSPYADWLAAGRPALHHLGYVVSDIEAATTAMAEAGFACPMRGRGYGADGTGGFSYFDTAAVLGYLTEAIERPGRRREPEATRPGPG